VVPKILFRGTKVFVLCTFVAKRIMEIHSSVHHNSVLTKIQPDATVCRYLFTAKSLYMFRVSQHPSSGVLRTVTAASGTVHNNGTATAGWIFINSNGDLSGFEKI